MKRGMVDVMVGLFVLLGFGALVFLAVRAGNMSSAVGLGETYRVSAKFDDIGGLKTRSAVRSAGVVVGRVAAARNVRQGEPPAQHVREALPFAHTHGGGLRTGVLRKAMQTSQFREDEQEAEDEQRNEAEKDAQKQK